MAAKRTDGDDIRRGAITRDACTDRVVGTKGENRGERWKEREREREK